MDNRFSVYLNRFQYIIGANSFGLVMALQEAEWILGG